MNIIIPMAGMGKRMRPHTLTTPKPLLEIAGKSIVERLIIDLANMVGGQVDEVSYIIGNFGLEVENKLHEISAKLGYKSKIYYQLEALGTAHALAMANESLVGNVLVAYADTLFNTDFVIDPKEDAYIWVKKIENPSQFGVVEHNQDGYITRFVEKPKEFVSDLAIIGIYYFKEGQKLRSEIEYLLENKITGNGEYQLTDALENLRLKGMKIKTTAVSGWFDCGNKNATVQTNAEILKLLPIAELIDKSVKISNSKIIEPCFLGKDVNIIDSEIGPFVSIGNGTIIETSKITNSIIYNSSHIKNATVDNSMIGSFVKYFNNPDNEVSLGDYSELI
jgi:glucose-1-phosphate thymidylyltransferase